MNIIKTLLGRGALALITVLITRPIAGPITIIALVLILLPLFKAIWQRVRKPSTADGT